MNETRIKKLLTDYNANRTEEIRDLIIGQLRGYSVISRRPDGQIDVDETMDGLAFALAANQTPIANCMSAEEFFAKPKPKIEADPVDGRPLRKGRTVTEPLVDWTKVPQDLRRCAAYAALVNQLPHVGAPCQGESVAAELSKGSDLPPPWPRLQAGLALLDAQAGEGKKEARRMIEQVEDRLVYTARSTPIAVAAPIFSSGASAPAGRISAPEIRTLLGRVLPVYSSLHAFLIDYFPAVSSNASNGMDRDALVSMLFEYVGHEAVLAALKQAYAPACAKHWPLSDAGEVDVFIIADIEDRAKVQDLLRHLFGIQNKVTSYDCPPGANASAWLSARLSSARLIVAVVSADLLANQVVMAQLGMAISARRRVCPLVVRPCLWNLSVLGPLSALPPGLDRAAADIYKLISMRS